MYRDAAAYEDIEHSILCILGKTSFFSFGDCRQTIQ